MNHQFAALRGSLLRWKTARALTLGVILFGGISALLPFFVQSRPQVLVYDVIAGTREIHTYSGVGVVLMADSRSGEPVVAAVLPGSPADGLVAPGSLLTAVNGQSYCNLDGWADAIRGEAGTVVALETVNHRRGHESILLTRQMIAHSLR